MKQNSTKTTKAMISLPRLSRRSFAPLLLAPLLIAAATAGGIQNVSAETTEHELLNDDYETWKGTSSGYESPDGTWLLVHPGHGYARVVEDGGDKIMIVEPELDDDDRHSALVLANEAHGEEIHGKMKVRLDEQGETGKSWDSFWAMLAYVDKTTHISFLIKSDDGGWMVSKRDHDHEGEDLHEVIAKGDVIPEADKGRWYDVEWWITQNEETDDLHVRLVVDGEELVNKDDDAGYDRDGEEGGGTSSFFYNSDEKTFGAYSEKSRTSWKDISVWSSG